MPSRLTPFVGWVWAALVAATIAVPARGVHAQALEPRSYANTPVGINFVLLGYGYTEGDVGFDASSPIKDGVRAPERVDVPLPAAHREHGGRGGAR